MQLQTRSWSPCSSSSWASFPSARSCSAAGISAGTADREPNSGRKSKELLNSLSRAYRFPLFLTSSYPLLSVGCGNNIPLSRPQQLSPRNY